ncbi:MAG: energy-coupling factor ABC transporter ATP-binding protein [Chloroflexota bacterium]|nr:energy-coupling factor ABC transporter ATP-binding protein [Chloroflexota bacterium]
MLELIGVSYRYAGYATEVLHEVDLRLDDGEIVGLVGPNEAGKSTLCLVASGLAPASVGGSLKGRLTLDGTPAAGLATHQLAERVVVGFQNPNTQRSGIAATVFEEIALGPMNLGLPVAETVERTREAIGRLRLEHLIERDPQRLSGGQAQLVGIASLLAMRPRHVILDEPTAQLDPAGTRLVGEALRALAETGTSLLIAEHKTDLLDAVCSRIVAIDAGRIVRDGPTAIVFDDSSLAEIGVEPPARARLSHAFAERGLDPSAIELALADGS